MQTEIYMPLPEDEVQDYPILIEHDQAHPKSGMASGFWLSPLSRA